MVDRGGLRYTIEIKDDFQQPLDRFTTGIKKAQAELERLRVAGVRARVATGGLAKDNDKAARSSERRTKANRNLSRTERIRAAAVRRANKDFDNQQISEQKAVVARRRRFAVERRLLSLTQARSQAERQVTREQNKALVAEQKRLVRAERGLSVDKRSVQVKRQLTEAERQLAAAKRRVSRASEIASNTQLRELNAQAAARERLNRIVQGQRTAQLLRQQGVNVTADPTTGALRSAAAQKKLRTEEGKTFKERIKNMRQFGSASRLSGSRANRAAFTFRRLFGILAAFAAARAVVSGFRRLVQETIRFQAAIEQSTLGVATLITASFSVRDAFGGAVSASQKLALAQGEARNQVRLLRRDALRTVATFEQLLATFQVAIAPGAKAGLNLDQIRKFTFDIANAAAAIGLEQNQLAEEIRSLLEGTIQARTTRIAVALGITNEDIRLAKEAGVLFDFLQDRFSAFSEASKEVEKNFNALWTNFIGGIQEVLLSGGVEFFEEIKDTILDLTNIIASRDPITRALVPSPEAVALVRKITGGLREALNITRRFTRTLNFNTLASLADRVGTAFAIAARIVSGIVVGFVRGARDLLAIIAGVGQTLDKIIGTKLFDSDNISEVIAAVTRISVLVIGIQIALGVVGSVTAVLGILWAAIAAAIAIVNILLTATAVLIAIIEAELLPVLLIVLAVIAGIAVAVVITYKLAKAVKSVASEVTGVELKWITFLKLVRFGLPAAFRYALAVVRFLWEEAMSKLGEVLGSAYTDVIDALLAKAERLLLPFAALNKTTRGWLEAIQDARAELEKTAQIDTTNTLVARLRRRFDFEREKQRFARTWFNIIKNADSDPTIGQAALQFGVKLLGKIADGIKAAVPVVEEALEGLGVDIEKLKRLFSGDFGSDEDKDKTPVGSTKEVKKMSQLLQELPGIIDRARSPLSANVELMKEMAQEVQSANDELREGSAILGQDSAQASQRRLLFKAENEIRDRTKKLITEQRTESDRLLDVRKRQVLLEERIGKLLPGQQQAIEEGVVLAREQLKLIKERDKAAKDVDLFTRSELGFIEKGNEARAAGARASRIAAEDSLALKEAELELLKAEADAINRNAGVTAEGAEEVLKNVKDRVLFEGQETDLLRKLTAIEEDRLRITGLINRALADRQTLLAREAAEESEDAARDLFAERLAFRREEGLKGIGVAQRRLRVAENEQNLLMEQRQELDRIAQKKQESFAVTLREYNLKLKSAQADALNAAGTDLENEKLLNVASLEEAILATEEAKGAAIRENAAAQGLLNDQLSIALEKVALARAAIDDPVGTGIFEGLRQAADEAPDLFQRTIDLTKNVIADFGSFISQTISDAFDPTKDVNLRNRFASFLSGIARQIVDMLVRVALYKAILLPFLGGAQGGGIPSAGSLIAGGAAEGGKVRKPTYGFRPAHAKARGFAGGGGLTLSEARVSTTSKAASLSKAIRPKNLDPRDTIPLWAAKDEWIIRARSARRYGDRVMDAINRGMIDPRLMRVVADISSSGGGVSRRKQGGMAAGGLVTPSVAAPVATAAPSSGGGGGPTPIIADDDLMQQLLNGGTNALEAWMRAKGYDSDDGRSRYS